MISNQVEVPVRNAIRELLQATGLFFLVFMALHATIQNFRIDGESMSPSLIHAQHVIVSKLAYKRINLSSFLRRVPFVSGTTEATPLISSQYPEYGDMVAFSYPNDPSKGVVKRVIGLPGDVIEFDEGQLIRNGEPVDESDALVDGQSFGPIWVRDGFLYVVGDNRRVSNDSRKWGLLHREYIVGRLWLSYWPSDRIQFLHAPW